jgi:DNA-binding response OmpR family regulator/anti-sigma regulatory factor (Ser/Thr protein kinase)
MTDQITILNVDDQEALRYVKSRDLRQAGFAVIEARTGAEALQAVQAHQPMVVLLDVQLPDISGYDVCKYVKQKWPSIMVIMTSATFTSSSDRTAGLDSGADSFLVQPAEPMELVAAINALLRIRRSEDELRRINDTLEQRVDNRTADLAAANSNLLKQIEHRRKAEAALVQAEKMQAVGQLTGGLAHDFNNLLTAVISNLDLIRERSTETRIRKHAESAMKAAERGAKLTAQLLAFSRTQKLSTKPVDVNALITGMHHLLDQSLGASITVELKLDARLPPGMGDINQLELAVLNLAINARDAMPGGGTLTISTAMDATDQYVTIAVADTGTGMSPETIARAFDPFYTTKPAGQGTGLGLSQVYGIAKQSGGDVTLQSQVDVGSTVTIALPRAHASVAAAPDVDQAIAPGPRAEKLLLVDDDGDVRSVMSLFLSDLGYDVREAANAERAIELLATFAPDLVIMDFAMPDMNGAETAVALRQHCPGVPILFCSGFADSEILDRAVGPAPILRKPFRPAQLAAAIRSALAPSAIARP